MKKFNQPKMEIYKFNHIISDVIATSGGGSETSSGEIETDIDIDDGPGPTSSNNNGL